LIEYRYCSNMVSTASTLAILRNIAQYRNIRMKRHFETKKTGAPHLHQMKMVLVWFYCWFHCVSGIIYWILLKWGVGVVEGDLRTAFQRNFQWAMNQRLALFVQDRAYTGTLIGIRYESHGG
jgi:hypothetical protein